MNRTFACYLLIGLTLVGVLIAVSLYISRGSHIRLEGAILKVRTLAMDEKSSVAVADFRFVNPASYPFVVRDVEISLIDASGNVIKGMLVADVDAKRLFEYFPILGQKYNPSLLMRDRVEARQSLDRMVSARFELPEAEVVARQALRILIRDVDGASSEIVEKKSPAE